MFLTFIGRTVRRFVGSNTLPSTMRPEFAPSRFTRNIGRQTLSTSLTTSLKSYRSESAKYDPTMAISSKQSNIGMLKISGSGTRTSNVERQSGALSPLLSVGILQAAQSQRWCRPRGQTWRMGTVLQLRQTARRPQRKKSLRSAQRPTTVNWQVSRQSV